MQTVNYTASDNVGVKVARAIVSGASWGEHHRGCNFAATIHASMALARSALTRDSSETDHTHLLSMQLDAADNVRHVEPPDGSRRQHRAGRRGARPRRRAGVAKSERLRPRVDESNRSGSRSHRGGSLSDLPKRRGQCIGGPGGPGAASQPWPISPCRGPANGRSAYGARTRPQTMNRPTPPCRFRSATTPSRQSSGSRRPHRADPTLVSVAVTDRVSGLASGQIEVSRQGTGTWQALPTERRGDQPHRPNRRFAPPAGVYALRATAWDHASNQNSTDRRTNGEPMTLSLPLRAPTVCGQAFGANTRFGDQSSDAESAGPSRSESSRSDHAQRCATASVSPSVAAWRIARAGRSWGSGAGLRW